MEYSPEAGESTLRDRIQFNLPNQTRWQKYSSYRNPKLRAPAPNLLYSHAFYTEGADVASRRPGANPHIVSIHYVNGQSCGLIRATDSRRFRRPPPDCCLGQYLAWIQHAININQISDGWVNSVSLQKVFIPTGWEIGVEEAKMANFTILSRKLTVKEMWESNYLERGSRVRGSFSF